MKTLNCMALVEATAPVQDRNNHKMFVKDDVNLQAMQLWKRYATGDSSDNNTLENTVLSLRGKTATALRNDYCFVHAQNPIEYYLSLDEYVWIDTLQSIINEYQKGFLFFDVLFHSHIPQNNYTLMRALLPFYHVLYENIKSNCGWGTELSLNASTSFEKCVAQICADSFVVSAKYHYDTEDISDRFFINETGDDTDFWQWIYSGGSIEIVERYPMCFKLLIRAMAQYVSNLKQMSNRINNDNELIRGILDSSTNDCRVVWIDFNLSDFHNKGQSVVIITFESGQKIVYKPRSTEIDNAWRNFILAFCRLFPQCTLSTPKVINCGSYGYVSYIENTPATDIQQYYFNAGALLCLCSLFGATDLHFENVLACGNSPVIIDLETIISPRPVNRFALIEADKLSSKTINVSRTLLLPRWVGSSTIGSCEIGGFTSTNDWGKNYHVLNGVRTSADQYSEVFIDGFKQVYGFIIANKSHIEAIISNCHFETCNFRYVFRRTALYSKLLLHFLHAAFLKSSRTYEAVLSRIGAGIVVSFDHESASLLWPIEISEENAIYDLDIPYFFCKGSSTGIFDYQRELIPAFLESEPIRILYDNLSEMTHERMNYEANFVQMSLVLSRCQPRDEKTSNLMSYHDIIRSRVVPNDAQIRNEISNLHLTLSDYCIDGLRFSYYAPVRDLKTTKYNLNLLENTFYSGIWGVLMFHAAYAKWKNDAPLSHNVIQKTQKLLHNICAGDDDSNFLRIGMADGIAGVLRSAICLSQILEQPMFLDEACQIAKKVGKDYLLRTDKADLFGGLAGYLYSTTQLFCLTNDSSLIPYIESCANLITMRLVNTTSNLKAWRSKMEYAPLTGLAHGQSGYILALALAYTVIDKPDILLAIQHALDYEEHNYVERANNWYDYRRFLVQRRNQDISDKYQERFMYGLCSGTPGIGLTRVALGTYIPELNSPEVIKRATDFCTTSRLVGCDNYCCGNAGWIDCLIEIGLSTKNDVLFDKAKEIATSIMPINSGHRYILSNLKGIYDVSMFTGISGIGYEFIRTQIPNDIPSPLIFIPGKDKRKS